MTATAEQLRAEAARIRYLARVERQLLRAGMPDHLAERVALVVDAPVDAEVEVITAAIAELRQDVPGLFPDAPGQGRETDGFGAEGMAEAQRRFGDRARHPAEPAAKPAGEGSSDPPWVAKVRARYGDEAADRALTKTT